MMGPLWGEYDDEMYGNCRKEMTRKVYESPKVGDLVRVHTLDGNAVIHDLCYNAVADLRVIGLQYSGGMNEIVLLVTGADEHAIVGRIHVSKQFSNEYRIDKKYFGCSSVVVNDYHLISIIESCNGATCDVCETYNPWGNKFDPDHGGKYRCFSCRQNPYARAR